MTDDDHAALRAEVEQRDKHIATLKARAALIGVELVLLADGSLVAMKWGWSKSLQNLAEAADWLDMAGAPR
jgi:hypothetical protein